MGPKGLQDIVDNAIDWVDRLGQMLPEMYNFNSPVERGQAANKAATYLSLVENQDTLIGFIARFAKSLDVSENVLTSAIKRVDVGVYEVAKDLKEGIFEGGTTTVYGLNEDAVGIPDTTANLVSAEILDFVNEQIEKFKSGELTAPKTEEEYNKLVK